MFVVLRRVDVVGVAQVVHGDDEGESGVFDVVDESAHLRRGQPFVTEVHVHDVESRQQGSAGVRVEQRTTGPGLSRRRREPDVAHRRGTHGVQVRMRVGHGAQPQRAHRAVTVSARYQPRSGS